MPSQTVSSGPIIGSTGSDWLEGSRAGSATGLGKSAPVTIIVLLSNRVRWR